MSSGILSDVVTIIDLTTRASRFLRASRAASEEYDSAKAVLGSLDVALSRLETFVQTHEATNSEAFKALLPKAREDWKKLKDHLDGYTEALSESTDESKPRKIYKSAKWALNERERKSLQNGIVQSTTFSVPTLITDMMYVSRRVG